MPISLTVTPNGGAAGQSTTIPGDGDIDNRDEAVAALALLPSGANANPNDKVTVGGRDYTRAQLEAIRDGQANPPTPADTSATHTASTSTYAPLGLYVLPSYLYSAGRHMLGGDLTLGWSGPFGSDARWRWMVGPSVGFHGGVGGDGTTSGLTPDDTATGVNSLTNNWQFRIGATGGFIGQPIANNGLFFGFLGSLFPFTATGIGLHRMNGDQYGTAYCPPGGGGIAGGDQGTGGCMNRPTGTFTDPGHNNDSSRTGFGLGLRLTGLLGYDFGPVSAALAPFVGGNLSYTGGTSAPEYGVGALVTIPLERRPIAARPASDDTTPVVDAAHASASGTVGQAASHSEDEIRTLGHLDANARILGVQFCTGTTCLDEDTTAPFEIPASAMTAGAHTMKIRYRNPSDTADHIKIVDYTVNAPITQTTNPSAAIPTVLANVARPAPVAGVAAGPLTIGQVEVTSALPRGSVYAIFVDGNEVGTVALQPNSPGTDHTVPITIPSSIADGAHQIGLRLRQPGQTEVRLNDRPITIGPAFPTLSAADAVADPVAPPYRYQRAPFSITVTASSPGFVRITAGGNTWDKPVVAGPNTISLLAQGETRQYYSGNVSIQPLTAQGGTLTGTAVQTTHSVILGVRAGGGGGHPAPRPARPLP